MRSSDWSSDVCSSDLAHTTPHQRGNRRVAGSPRRTIHHPPRARRTRAMSVIGTFTPVKDGGWAGTIRTLTIEVKARFVPNDNRDSERTPEFRIFAGRSELGAAWREHKSGTDPREYMSGRIDGPGLPQTVSPAMYGAPAGRKRTENEAE